MVSKSRSLLFRFVDPGVTKSIWVVMKKIVDGVKLV